MEISYANKRILYKTFFSPKETVRAPEYKLSDLGYKYYTLIMYDPDAIHGNYWHWVIHIHGNKHKQILSYVGATPPDDKIHHYTFELYGRNTPLVGKSFKNRSISLNAGKELLGLGLDRPILMEVFSSKKRENTEKAGYFRKTVRKSTKKRRTIRRK